MRIFERAGTFIKDFISLEFLNEFYYNRIILRGFISVSFLFLLQEYQIHFILQRLPLFTLYLSCINFSLTYFKNKFFIQQLLCVTIH